jgi:hypothetical protein
VFLFTAKFPYLHYVVFNNNNAPLRTARASSQDRVNGGGGGGAGVNNGTLNATKELLQLDSKNQLFNILNSQGAL